MTLTAALAVVVFFLRSDSASVPIFPDATFDRPEHVRVRLTSLGPPPWSVAGAPLVVGGDPSVEFDASVSVTASADLVEVSGISSTGSIELSSGDGVVRIGDARYVGRVVVTPGTRPRPVVLVELEQYVEQVIPREMPLSFPRAALLAQAVAIRSYVVNETKRRRSRDWDVVDTEHSQVFGGSRATEAGARDIVATVRNVVLEWNGRPLPAFFSSTCGGRTRSSRAAFGGREMPPLTGGPCGFCKWSREYRWSFSVGVEEFRRAAGLDSRPRRVVWEPGKDERGAVIAVMRNGRRYLDSSRLRSALRGRRMRSTWITGAELSGDRVALQGRGYGHGVGMCQNGARGMADAGYDMTEILDYYYPGAVPVELRR